MADRIFRSRPAWIFSAGLVVVASLVLGVALAIATEPAPEVIDAVPLREPEPFPVPEPEPEPEPPSPVEGEIADIEVSDMSATGSRLFHEGSDGDEPVPVDDDAVEEFVTAMAAWLDAHLTDLQDDGPGLVEGLAGDTEPVAAGLSNPDAPVETATYRFLIAARGTPEWGSVVVAVHRGRGVTQQARYTFVPGKQLTLVAAEVLPVVVDPPDGSKEHVFSAADGEAGA